MQKLLDISEDHLKNYTELFELLDYEIDRRSRNRENGVKLLRSIRKRVLKLRKQLPHITRSRELRKIFSLRKRSENNGLTNKCKISKELSEFLKVPEDTLLSRVDAMCAICVYIKYDPSEERENLKKWSYLNSDGKRNLQDLEVKNSIKPDKKLSKLLGFEEYKKDIKKGLIKNSANEVIKDDKLYYKTLQTLLKHHFIK